MKTQWDWCANLFVHQMKAQFILGALIQKKGLVQFFYKENSRFWKPNFPFFWSSCLPRYIMRWTWLCVRLPSYIWAAFLLTATWPSWIGLYFTTCGSRMDAWLLPSWDVGFWPAWLGFYRFSRASTPTLNICKIQLKMLPWLVIWSLTSTFPSLRGSFHFGYQVCQIDISIVP